MDISADSEINEYSSESDNLDGHWSAVDAGISNMNPKQNKMDNHEKNKGDVQNLSDISVSSVDTYTPKSQHYSKYLMPIEITNWEPLLIEDKLVISGNIAGLVQTDRICKTRLSSLIFKDDDGVTCCILGPMKAQSDVPDAIRSQFKYIYRIEKDGEKILKDGIPENWLQLCSIWKFYTDTVNKNTFDWPFHFKIFSFQPLDLNNIGRHLEKIVNNGPKTKIKKKFEKYKSMLEQELLRDTMMVESESDTDIQIQKKLKKKKVNHQDINGYNNKNTAAIQTNFLETDTPTSSTILTEQTSLNKRTSCYIQNQIVTESDEQSAKITVQCQTDLTLNDFVENELDEVSINERNDKNQSTNVTILSPTKPLFRSKNALKSVSENCAINDQLNKKSKNESNKKIIASNTILKELTNKETACNNIESNDDTSSLEFYENIVANSTAIVNTPPILVNCKRIHYICSKTLERFEKNNTPNTVNNTKAVDNFDVIDIDIFSRNILNMSVPKDHATNISASAVNEPVNNVDPPDPKELKTIKNNLEKTGNTSTSASSSSTITEQSYSLRSPKRYIATNQTKGLKRKKNIEVNDEKNTKKIALTENKPNPESSKPTRVSLRNRKKLNYRELLFNRIKLPENSILDSKLRKDMMSHNVLKKSKKQIKNDEKLFKKCFVILKRENLAKRKNTNDVVSTSNFTVTNVNVEKENSTPEPQTNTIVMNKTAVQASKDHVFKTPLTTVVKRKKNLSNSNQLPKLNKTLHIPNYMPKIKDQKKLSLPANPIEMWKMISLKAKTERPQPPSQFSLLLDSSSDASDKKRRKLFSPDNWMQSDGCLKNLSQNQYQSSDSRFSLRFDDTDPNMDSELSDSSTFTSY